VTLNDSVAVPVGACAIPNEAVVPLKVGIRRLFVDGYNGIESNGNARLYQLEEVQACENCSEVCNCNADCIDDDEWSRLVDKALFGEEKESVDLLLYIRTARGADKLLFVEGKLGSLVNAYTGQNTYPTWQSLSEKYQWTKKRIGNRVSSCNSLYIIVSQDSIAQMRHRLNAYVLAGRLPTTKLLCPHEFWRFFSLADSFGSVACNYLNSNAS